EVYVSQPDGFVDPDKPNSVYRLKKDLYGLKQAPSASDSSIALIAFANADHAGCQDTRRSTSGSMQFLGDRLVSWSSKRQEKAKCVSYQLADIFTKALGRERIEFLINKLGMRSFTPETLKQLADEVDK
ncbi:retrovirus-related pol polyprotein from transposon TNT 1-94, partial [Tanacetum coccineum]